MTGTGTLDEDLSGGTCDMELKAGGGLIDSHFTGNNCEAKSFNLPLGLGKLDWDGIACPLKARPWQHQTAHCMLMTRTRKVRSASSFIWRHKQLSRLSQK